jgi:Arc/MetJ-type ribon-helix-helix transcriptional regulator
MSKPQYRIPDELDKAIGKLVEKGLFPSKQSFVTVAVGKLAMEYGIVKVKNNKK